jgi:hypothetical protein
MNSLKTNYAELNFFIKLNSLCDQPIMDFTEKILSTLVSIEMEDELRHNDDEIIKIIENREEHHLRLTVIKAFKAKFREKYSLEAIFTAIAWFVICDTDKNYRKWAKKILIKTAEDTENLLTENLLF